MSLCHNHSPTAVLFTSLNVFLLIIIYFNGFEYRSVQYYSEALEKNNEMIRLHKAKDEQKIVRKRKIFLEVEVSEDEYQAFMKQTK